MRLPITSARCLNKRASYRYKFTNIQLFDKIAEVSATAAAFVRTTVGQVSLRRTVSTQNEVTIYPTAVQWLAAIYLDKQLNQK